MDFAVSQLEANKKINLVMLSIGANDGLLVLPLLEQCGADPICAQNILGPVLQTYGANLKKILTGGAMPTLIGLSIHRELELLVKSGLTPTQALASATANVADAFRLSDRGRILPGQRANLLLVRDDPTIDITATRDVLRVWRSGVEFDRSVQQPR